MVDTAGGERPDGRVPVDVDTLAAVLTGGAGGRPLWWTVPAAVAGAGVTASVAGLSAVIGMSDDGAAVGVDIMAAPLGGDGPHGIVLGGPRTGKSELLLTLALSLAATYPPDALRILLIGGAGPAPPAGLGAVSVLPHVTCAGSTLPPGPQRGSALLAEVAQWIDADSLQRRRELRPVHPARRPRQGPHLLVLIDDYHLLDADPQTSPGWRRLVWRLVSRGPALNQHVVLASEALPLGLRVVLPHTGFRIVVGGDDVDAPADFSRGGRPGRALVAVGDRPPVAVDLLHPSADSGRVRDELIDRILVGWRQR